jgi:localization factor PodJL
VAQVEAPESEPDEIMNSRVSWSVDGIDPSVRDRAEAAARRAGMSLNDWLNANIGDAPPDFRNGYEPPQPAYGQQHRAVDDIHQRLDSITRQIEQISKPRAEAPRGNGNGHAPRGEPAVARQLNDAISRLDARLSQITNPHPGREAQRQDRQRQAHGQEADEDDDGDRKQGQRALGNREIGHSESGGSQFRRS